MIPTHLLNEDPQVRTTKELIRQEVLKLITEVKLSLKDVKRFAISEAWKILQLVVAVVVQIIEELGENLSGPEKKKVALEVIENFYDTVLGSIDIPGIPSFMEPMFHNSVKSFMMIFVGASIDAMVATFRNVGVFKSKYIDGQSTENNPVDKLLDDISRIVRK
jgi:hypothetical protein